MVAPQFQPISLLLTLYSGHGGTATSEHVSKVLPEKLMLQKEPEYAQTFVDLDNDLLSKFTTDHDSFRGKSEQWEQNARNIRAGSTALVVDIAMDTLSVKYANAGDCRAVVRNPGAVGIQQTTDLNAKTKSECERLQLDHPGEDQMVISGRLFGKLMSTRGD